MSLLGMPGYVIIGNSLLHPPVAGRTHPECEYLYTPTYYIHGFQWRRQCESVEVISVPETTVNGTDGQEPSLNVKQA